MKKIFFGILVILPTLSSQASTVEIKGALSSNLYSDQLNAEKSHFEVLGELYKAGTLPELAQISNIAWAGRCFGKNAPNEPQNAGYIFREKEAAAVGQNELNSKSYEAFSYWNLSEAPNFFDNLNLDQVYALQLKMDPHPAKIKMNSIEIDLSSTTKSNLRVSGKYLIEELSGTDGDVGPIGQFSTDVRCYYFIPELKP